MVEVECHLHWLYSHVSSFSAATGALEQALPLCTIELTLESLKRFEESKLSTSAEERATRLSAHDNEESRVKRGFWWDYIWDLNVECVLFLWEVPDLKTSGQTKTSGQCRKAWPKPHLIHSQHPWPSTYSHMPKLFKSAWCLFQLSLGSSPVPLPLRAAATAVKARDQLMAILTMTGCPPGTAAIWSARLASAMDTNFHQCMAFAWSLWVTQLDLVVESAGRAVDIKDT